MSEFNLVLLSDLTTDEKLSQLEADGEKYIGLYVDMDNDDERRYVKDQASEIKSLQKSLEEKRKSLNKKRKTDVDNEAAEIDRRLAKANEPLTKLIDEWNAERKRILDEEKCVQAAIELQAQIESDHDEAIQLNRLWDLEKVERERQREIERHQQIDREKQIAEQAAKQALTNAESARQAQMQQEESERLKREANIDHKKHINNAILAALTSNGISEDDAKKIITLAVKGELPNVKVWY
jgi:hypothetical protein